MSSSIADPDLAGPGVMLAFILSGFITLITSFAIQRLRKVEDHKPQKRLGPAASWWYRAARSWAPANTSNPVSFWISTLLQFVRGLSDQQLITGPLLLIVAYIKYLPSGDIPNLNTAAHASYFSMVSHLASMRVLDGYLREHRTLGYVRFGIVALSFALLFATFIAIRHRVPLYPDEDTSVSPLYVWLAILFSATVLITAYLAMLLRFLTSSHAVALRDSLRWTYVKPSAEALLWARNFRFSRDAVLQSLVDWYLVAVWQNATQDILLPYRLRLLQAEGLLQWYWTDVYLWSFFTFSLVTLALDWHDGKLSNSWGFGQILPVALLLLPLFTLMENYSDQAKENEEQNASTAEAMPQMTDSSENEADEQNSSTVGGTQLRSGNRTLPMEPREGVQKRPTAGKMV